MKLPRFLREKKVLLKRALYWNGSKNYWENRYHAGGNSGAGSYNQLSLFKANVINHFVKENAVKSVIEWGCGDGNQLSLAEYPFYIGIDVSETAIELCKRRYYGDLSKVFICNRSGSVKEQCDLALSLDVIYHLVEDEVYHEYMNNLFMSSRRFVCIYSCNYDDDYDVHVKCRRFTSWVEANQPNWKLDRIIKNKYPYNPNDKNNTSWSDFYFYVRIDLIDG